MWILFCHKILLLTKNESSKYREFKYMIKEWLKHILVLYSSQDSTMCKPFLQLLLKEGDPSWHKSLGNVQYLTTGFRRRDCYLRVQYPLYI